MSESQMGSSEDFDWNESGREIRDQAVTLASNIRTTAQRVERTIEKNATQRPWAALGIAAGIGFVLGGGLSPRIFAGLMALGTKLAFDVVVARALDGAGHPTDDEG